jgi:hypothetical protein
MLPNVHGPGIVIAMNRWCAGARAVAVAVAVAESERHCSERERIITSLLSQCVLCVKLVVRLG